MTQTRLPRGAKATVLDHRRQLATSRRPYQHCASTMTLSCLRLQVKPKRTRCVWYGSSCEIQTALYTYGLISRSTSLPSRRFRTGQRQARRLGTSLASISRQAANTLLSVTLVDVFCYITSKIMMHTEGHDDRTLYYVHSLHVYEKCIRGHQEQQRQVENNGTSEE